MSLFLTIKKLGFQIDPLPPLTLFRYCMLNCWVSAYLAPAFILLCKILTLRIIFEFYFRKKIFFYKTKVAQNYEKIKVK